MAGRAGRYGYRETGRAIILADTPFERQRLFERYVLGPVEPISSSFKPGDLATWIVRLLRQVDGIPRADVATMLLNTYGGYMQARRDMTFASRLQATVPPLLTRMDQNGLLTEDGSGVHLTALGRACGQSTLGFESCLQLLEALRSLGSTPISPTTLLALTEALPESDETYVPLQRKGTAEHRWLAATASRLGATVAQLMGRGADTLKIAARAKRTLIALAWADGMSIERIEGSFSANPFNAVAAGDVRSIAESARFRLRSAYEITIVALPMNAPAPEAMDALFLQLEFGIPGEALSLLTLRITLSRAENLMLVGAGFCTPAAIWTVRPDDLRQRLPKALADKLESVRPESRLSDR